MNLHILFCPSQSILPDGSRLPTASLPLSLDDEVQYRCAGFIQAEIERYGDELDDGASAPDKGSEDDEDESDGSQSEGDGRGKASKNNVSKGKPSARKSPSGEKYFLTIISTYLNLLQVNVQLLARC